MMRKKLEWLKRGACLVLAGTLVLCSENVSYAAMTTSVQAETQDSSETSDQSETETENAGKTGTDENTEQEKTTEATESTEATETTETTEATETTENTEVTETTETTETTEETEATEETENKEEKIPNGVTLNTAVLYRVIAIGEQLTLPEYTISYTDPSATGSDAEVVWSDDGLGIISLDAAGNKVTGVKAGVTTLTLQVKGTQYATEYHVIVTPVAPASVNQTATTYQSAELSWSAVEGAKGYRVYRKGESDAEFQMVAEVEGNTSYKDSGLELGTKYIYRIKSYVTYKDASNTQQYAESDTYGQIAVTLSLGKTTIESASAVAYNSVQIRWRALEGAEGYTVYRAEGASNSFAELSTVTGTDYTDNNVVAGTTYRYQVKGYRTVNGTRVYGTVSDAAAVKPMPGTTNLSSEVKSVTSVKLSWDKVSGVSGYEVYRKVSGDDDFKKIKTVEGGNKTSYTDKKLKTGTKYVYIVRAYCGSGSSKVYGEYSNQTVATPTIAAPSEVSVENTTYNSITIKWGSMKGVEGYKVLRATSINGKYKTVATVKGKSNHSYVNKKLSAGTNYYYKVCAYKTVNGKKVNGLASEPLQISVVAPATTVKSEAAGATAIKLTWTKVDLPSSGSGYNIYLVTNGVSKKVKSCKRKATSYTVKNLTPGEKYTFKVVPYTKNSKKKVVLGLDSNLLTATPTLLAPAIEKAASASDGTIQLTWKATTGGESGYEVYRSTSKKKGYSLIGTVAVQSGISEYTFEDANIAFGKKYYYKVRCTRTLENGTGMASAYSAVKAVTAGPAAPTLTVKASGSDQLKLSWKKVKMSSGSYVDGYVIYRSTTEKGTYKKVTTIKNGKTTSYTDKGLVTGNTYYYKIRAYYKSGGKNVYSADSAVVSKQVTPSKPTVTAASLDYQTVRVSWKQVTGASGYQIKRSETADGTYKSVKTINSASTLYFDNSKLTTGKTYYYKVRAFVKKNGKKIYGEYSDVQSAAPVLGMPTNLAGTSIDNNQIKLTWTAVAGAKTYTIVRSTSLTGTYKIASEICDTNSFIDSNVSIGKTYYYKVQAIRDNLISDFTTPIAVTAAALELSTTSVTMKTGTNMKITAKATPDAYVAWSSDNAQIAVVTSDGTIYALKAGTTTISATANNMTKKVTVTVKDKLGTENKGLELSASNGTINFNNIKSAGYEYVMLRITNGTTEDKNFKTNLKNAKAAGLKVGVICYSTAQTKTGAESEAKKVLSILNGEKLDYPVVYDLESEKLLYNNVTKTERVEFVKAFQSQIVNAGKGYSFILGISQSLLKAYPEKYLDTSLLTGMDLWIYNCRAENLGHGYQGTGNVVMWRYSDSATVDGVSGKVSISNRYKTY